MSPSRAERRTPSSKQRVASLIIARLALLKAGGVELAPASAQEIVDRGIDPRPLAVFIAIKATPVLAPLALVVGEPRERGRSGQALAEGVVCDLGDLGADVEPHLVEQREG